MSFSVINNLATPPFELQINFGVLQTDAENSSTEIQDKPKLLFKTISRTSQSTVIFIMFRTKQNTSVDSSAVIPLSLKKKYGQNILL